VATPAPLLSRRRTLGLGLSAALCACLPAGADAADEAGADTLRLRFLQWSRVATGFSDLSAAAAAQFLTAALQSQLHWPDLAGLDPGVYQGTALEKRLLRQWYAGIFPPPASAGPAPLRLMWRAIGLDPSSGACANATVRWDALPVLR